MMICEESISTSSLLANASSETELLIAVGQRLACLFVVVVAETQVVMMCHCSRPEGRGWSCRPGRWQVRRADPPCALEASESRVNQQDMAETEELCLTDPILQEGRQVAANGTEK